MGSVDENYPCPWCNRRNGGYSPDGVDIPVCTGGAYSCLWFQFIALGRTTKEQAALGPLSSTGTLLGKLGTFSPSTAAAARPPTLSSGAVHIAATKIASFL